MATFCGDIEEPLKPLELKDKNGNPKNPKGDACAILARIGSRHQDVSSSVLHSINSGGFFCLQASSFVATSCYVVVVKAQ
jgi:hypothetical protein